MLYQSLPATWEDAKPILEMMLQQNASTVQKVAGSSRRRPDPPRDLQVVIGTLDVTISWTPPANTRDIAGWRVYKDNESNLIDRIADSNTTQSKIKLSVSAPTAFYVSSVNALGLESIKIQALGTPADALGAEPTSVVSGPTTITNVLTNGGALGQYVQGLTVKFPGEIQFDVESASDGSAVNQIVDVLLFASAGAAGPNGYFARFDSRAGFNAGQILKVTNGTWANIGSFIAGTNAAMLSGWHHVTLRVGANGVMDIWVDGIYQCTATDQTFTPTGALYYGAENTPGNPIVWPILAPPHFVNRQLDQVPDGTSFGRTPASNYGPNTPVGKITGFQILSNPDFQNGTTNWATYDNNTSGSVTMSLVADTAAPGGMGQKLKIVELKVGVGPTPGLGGFTYRMGPDTGGIFADGYHVGDTYIIDLVANIPVGYTINWASNSLGTGGSFTWLSQRAGTGNWQHYILRVVIGPGIAANAFPYFFLTGTDGVTWYVGHMAIIDVDQPHRHGGRVTAVGADGTMFDHAVGISSAGVGNLIHAGNVRTYLTGTPNWGFYGSPGMPVDVFASAYTIRGKGGNPSIRMDDTNASGRNFGFASGTAAGAQTIDDITAAASRTILIGGPQWGFFGTPLSSPTAADVSTFGGGKVYASSSGAVSAPGFGCNDTATSHHSYEYQAGGSGLNQMDIYDLTAGATRIQMNTTPQWGFYGSPGQAVDIFSQVAEIINNGSNPQLYCNDTEVGGKISQFGNGFPVAGNMFLYSNGSTRYNCDTSGNIDLQGSTPTSGFITAGQGKISDTSGNLVLKNIGSATATTSGPFTTSSTYAVIAEMTITATFKGNKVIMIFTASTSEQVSSSALGFFAIFKDGSQLSHDFQILYSANSDGSAQQAITTLVLIDQPTAASHTYDVRWKVNTSKNLSCNLLARTWQVVELG